MVDATAALFATKQKVNQSHMRCATAPIVGVTQVRRW